MKTDELLMQLNEFKEGFTEQSISMRTYRFTNDYINVIRIDTSNKGGGEEVRQGKQWSIIFERTTDQRVEELLTFRDLAQRSGYITITPRRRYPNHYGIRFYHMAKNPNTQILDAIFDYLFDNKKNSIHLLYKIG
jgi:hypothetical protein